LRHEGNIAIALGHRVGDLPGIVEDLERKWQFEGGSKAADQIHGHALYFTLIFNGEKRRRCRRRYYAATQLARRCKLLEVFRLGHPACV